MIFFFQNIHSVKANIAFFIFLKQASTGLLRTRKVIVFRPLKILNMLKKNFDQHLFQNALQIFLSLKASFTIVKVF